MKESGYEIPDVGAARVRDRSTDHRCFNLGFLCRTIRFIVPVPAGASTDFIARLVAAQVGATEGITTVVENRPGAAGMIGTEYVSRQAADGNTILITPGSYLIDAQSSQRDLSSH